MTGEPSLLDLATDPKAARRARQKAREEEYQRRVEVFTRLLAGLGEVPPVQELQFALPSREWKFDLAWPEARVALEVDGGVFMPGGGRHTRGAGFREDQAKTNAAALLGWRVLRILPEQLDKSSTAAMVAQALRLARTGAPGTPERLPDVLLDSRKKKAPKVRA